MRTTTGHSNVEAITGLSHPIPAGDSAAKNKIVGVLEALNERGKIQRDRRISLLLVLGAQAAVAIENTRLFQTIRPDLRVRPRITHAAFLAQHSHLFVAAPRCRRTSATRSSRIFTARPCA